MHPGPFLAVVDAETLRALQDMTDSVKSVAGSHSSPEALVAIVVALVGLVATVVGIGVLWGRFSEKVSTIDTDTHTAKAELTSQLNALRAETRSSCDSCISERKHVEENVLVQIEAAKQSAETAQRMLDTKLDEKLGKLFSSLDEAKGELNFIKGQLAMAFNLPSMLCKPKG